MGRPKGQEKSGGRKKGTPNKNTLNLTARCEELGVDPWALLLDYVIQPCPMDLRFQALKEICSYLFPKRKAIEHSGEITNPYMEMELTELEAMVKSKLKEKK